MNVLLWVLAISFVVAGFAGTVLPFLPGTPLVFLGLILAAAADGFVRVGMPALIAIGLVLVASILLEVFAAAFGAKITGAGRKALLGAMSGALLGLPFGLPGLILGPLVGAGIGEYLDVRSWPQATKAAAGTLLGIVLAVAFKLGTACVMVAIFIAAWFY